MLRRQRGRLLLRCFAFALPGAVFAAGRALGVTAHQILLRLNVAAQGLAQLAALPGLRPALKHAVLQAGADAFKVFGHAAQAFGLCNVVGNDPSFRHVGEFVLLQVLANFKSAIGRLAAQRAYPGQGLAVNNPPLVATSLGQLLGLDNLTVLDPIDRWNRGKRLEF